MRLVIAARRFFSPGDSDERWAAAMAARSMLLVLGVIGLVVHALWPHVISLDAGECALYAIVLIVGLVPILQSFTLPGGASAVIANSASVATASSVAVAAETEAKLALLKIAEVEPDSADSPPPAAELTPQAVAVTEATVSVTAPPAMADVPSGWDFSAAHRVPVTRASSIPDLGSRERLVILRVDLVDALRASYQALHGDDVPTVASRLINALRQDEVLSDSGARIVSAVLTAANAAAHSRTIPNVSAIDVAELTESTEVLLRDLPVATHLAFNSIVGRRLVELAAPTTVIQEPGNGWDFQVGENLVVEAKYFPPGAQLIAIEALTRVARLIPSGARLLIVTSNNTVFQAELNAPFRVRRLSDLTADDLK
jgi:hypothetical protein